MEPLARDEPAPAHAGGGDLAVPHALVGDAARDAEQRGDDTEADPIAFLLTHAGEVRSDADMVFYGQPDHGSGAVTLAADETGAATTLHLSPRKIPADITEILLVAQLPADHPNPGSAHLIDLDTGQPLGHLSLPATGTTGLLQLGALQRTDGRWHLQLASAGLDHDLAALAAAAGVQVD